MEFDSLEDLLLGLLSESLEPRQLVLLARLPEIGDRRDAQLLPHDARLLGAEGGDRDHGDHAFGDLLAELFVEAELTRGDELGDLLFHGLADAGDVAELLVAADVGEIDGEALDRARGVVIRADLEGVLVLEFEKLPDRVEDLRDLPVIHRGAVRGRRRISPADVRRGRGAFPCRPIRRLRSRS